MSAPAQGPIVLVSDADDFGGAEVYLATLAAALRERHRFVAIVGDGAGERTRRHLARAGAEVRTVQGLDRMPRPGPVRRLAGTLRALAPAVVHVNATDQGDGRAGLLAGRLAGRPVVVTLHLAVDGRGAWRERTSAWTLRLASEAIAVSDAVAGRLSSYGLRPVVVHNGLPAPELAADARRTLAVEDAAFVVGGIGRLTAQKGWDVLARAAPQVRERVPGAAFVVIGEGPERAALERLAGGSVRFAGARDDAAALLAAFDVLAVPSRYEGLPLAPIEAMHAGVPVVAADVPGLREVVGEAGLMVAPEAPEALAAALERLARDETLRIRLGAQARTRAGERFSVARMAAETAAVYDRLAAG